MESQTLQDLAREARAAFSNRTRADGSKYWAHESDAPEWIVQLAIDGHGRDIYGNPSMWLDDTRFAFIVDALDELEEVEDVDEAGHTWEFEYRYHALVKWLGTYAGQRLEYAEEYRAEFGIADATPFALLQGGHLAERLEVLHLVRASLEAQLATLEEV